MNNTNQAVLCPSFGLEQLAVCPWPEEPIGPGLVRVAVAAVSLNYRDYLMITGGYYPKLNLPLIPCSDGAGRVLEVGEGVTELAVGDRVCTTMIPDWFDGAPTPAQLGSSLGGPQHGMLARERVLPQQALVRIPDHLSWEEAACLPVAGLTAWTALHSGDPIGPGSSVLLLGTGGVSIMALPIARSLGADVLITSSSQAKGQRAVALGARAWIDYASQPQWDKAVRSYLPDGCDLVLEVGGDGTFDRSVKAVRNGGTLALIGVLARENRSVNLTSVLMRAIRVQGILVGSRAHFAAYLAFVAAKRPAITIDRCFQGLEQAQAAFAHLATGSHFGKIVVRIAD